jgi:hypothetical protein
MEMEDGTSLAAHIRDHLVSHDFPIFQLFERPAHDMLNVPVTVPNTVNLSKLDRQGILGTLASVLSQRDSSQSSKGLAA